MRCVHCAEPGLPAPQLASCKVEYPRWSQSCRCLCTAAQCLLNLIGAVARDTNSCHRSSSDRKSEAVEDELKPQCVSYYAELTARLCSVQCVDVHCRASLHGLHSDVMLHGPKSCMPHTHVLQSHTCWLYHRLYTDCSVRRMGYDTHRTPAHMLYLCITLAGLPSSYALCCCATGGGVLWTLPT